MLVCTSVVQHSPVDEQLAELVVTFIGGNGECSVSRRGDRGSVDVCPFVQQHPAHLCVAPRRRLHEGSETSLMERRGEPSNEQNHTMPVKINSSTPIYNLKALKQKRLSRTT